MLLLILYHILPRPTHRRGMRRGGAVIGLIGPLLGV